MLFGKKKNMTIDFISQTKLLIDSLKGTCASYGLGNDGNEFKIITQTFLYKFMNDKFAHTVKKQHPHIAKADSWEAALSTMNQTDYEMMLLGIGPDTPKLKPDHFIRTLFQKQTSEQFAELFDDTLLDIAAYNNNIFSVRTNSGTRIALFERLSRYIADPDKRDDFCRAIINKLVDFSFEHVFNQKYDFFATIFEYLIKDYNKDGGGKYAEYYTPHAVANIMARILVDKPVKSVTCFDPSAGSGTLLMCIAHQIGENKCTIYSQDISQKSTGMLRLNLILNDLAHSIQNIIQGNTLLLPYHRKPDGSLQKFDFIVSNPPFKLDFSDYREQLDSKENRDRFFAGIPKVPNKDVDKMAIYTLFIQHIMHTLSAKGRAAIVVPTGFITAQSGIEKAIRQQMVEKQMLRGVVSMPSNIFATTGTNVSILFLDKGNKDGKIVLMDASKLGETVKEGKNQKTFLRPEEEAKIIETFNRQEAVDDFTVVVGYEDIVAKNYSLSAGQYFDVKIEYTDITPAEFEEKLQGFQNRLNSMFAESRKLEKEIEKQLGGLIYG